VSCSAPLGTGGLGRHLQELLAALDRRNEGPSVCICESGQGAAPSSRHRQVRARVLTTAFAPLTRLSPAWRVWKVSVAFDADAVRRLPAAADHLMGFNGTTLAQFRAAGRARYGSLSLISATAHLRLLARRQAQAHSQYPLERPWATRLVKRNLAEYAQADRVYVSSRYAWQSFVEEGFPDERLSFFPLTPDPRFTAGGESHTSDTFDVVYVGGLTVDKGVPLLIDAVRRIPHRDLRLLLVGGWKTRGMRRFVQEACAADPRIEVRAGDPLVRLRSSRLYVHAAYSDGFSYAAAEALACGLPAIVSEDTGMKDLIDSDRDGLVLPTGDLDALTQAIGAAYRGEILGG
jgi:glycosyltransferase involved in cell wall biosynthesis